MSILTEPKLEKLKRQKRLKKQFVSVKMEEKPEKPKKGKKAERLEYFQNREDGLYLITGWMKESGPEIEREVRMGDSLTIRARACEDGGEGWGIWLEWADPNGLQHRWVMPAAMLSQPGSAWLSALQDGGYIADPSCAAQIKKYLATQTVAARARVTRKTGWTADGVFVLPDAAIGAKDEEEVILAAGGSAAYAQGGTMEGWQKLAAQAQGNSRLVFALSAALAGPLLYITGQESGGFNFVGASSTGKSTALRLAASVWGGPDYVKSWRTTDNAAEGTAVFHNDSLLILDELGQATAKTCSEMSYMLSNGAGKTRASRDGTARAVQTWRVLFLSSGEVGLADKLAEAGQRPKAGQEVRLVDFPADAGAGLGIFERVEEGMTPGQAAIGIKDAVKKDYGHAGRAFVSALVEGGGEAEKWVRTALAEQTAAICPAGADGQVQRVASRFALCAVAGMFAVRHGILPLAEQDIVSAAKTCFNSWVCNRGGIGSGEDQKIVETLHCFIETHGQSRFQDLNPPEDKNGNARPQTVVNRAGFRDGSTFYILQEQWKMQVFQGFDAKRAAKILNERGYLKGREKGRLLSKETLPDLGATRCYVVRLPENEE